MTTNYTSLITAVQAITEDDGTEFATYIPTAMNLAEERLFKELELPELEERTTGTLTPGVNTLTKPSTTEFVSHLTVTLSGKKVQLQKKSESFIEDYWPVTTTTGSPKYYADRSPTQVVIAPTPSTNSAYTIRYTKKPTKISTSVATNYFTDNCNDALFYAIMVEMTKFMKAWSQVQLWEQNFMVAKESWNTQMARYRRDGEMNPRNPNATGQNTIKHTMQTNA